MKRGTVPCTGIFYTSYPAARVRFATAGVARNLRPDSTRQPPPSIFSSGKSPLGEAILGVPRASCEMRRSVAGLHWRVNSPSKPRRRSRWPVPEGSRVAQVFFNAMLLQRFAVLVPRHTPTALLTDSCEVATTEWICRRTLDFDTHEGGRETLCCSFLAFPFSVVNQTPRSGRLRPIPTNSLGLFTNRSMAFTPSGFLAGLSPCYIPCPGRESARKPASLGPERSGR